MHLPVSSSIPGSESPLTLLAPRIADLSEALSAMAAQLGQPAPPALHELLRPHLAALGGLTQLAERVERLVTMGLALLRQTEPEPVLRGMLEWAARVVDAECIGVMLFDARTSKVRWICAQGCIEDTGAPLAPLLQQVRQTRLPLRKQAEGAAALAPEELPAGHPPAGGYLGVPLLGRGEIDGVLSFSRAPGAPPFSEDDQTLASMLATAGAVIYENTLTMAELQRSAFDLRQEATQRQKAKLGLQRLNRFHQMLSAINALVLRERDRRRLFEDACRIAVEVGYFRMAFVGLVDDDHIRIAAAYGADVGYTQLADIRIGADDPHGLGPTGRSVRERRVQFCNDIANDPVMLPWREAALERGYRASVSCPLVVDDKAIGAFTLYAGEVDFFDEEELRLLSSLSDNIVYALTHIERQEQLDYLAYYDPLTGLAQRRLFLDWTAQFLAGARAGRHSLAVMVFDLDHFKSINDAVGLAGGDRLLRHCADRLRDIVGKPGSLARLGSDRFAAVISLEGHGVLDQIKSLGGQVQRRLAEPYQTGGQEFRLSSKIGAALFPGDADDAASLLQHAETALKEAKASGEPLLLYAQSMGEASMQTLTLETRLRRAIERGEFTLHYQPKVDLRSGEICGAEALLRWYSPDTGLVSPADFIPQLEESGLILEVGRWVLEEVVAHCRQWRLEGIRVPSIALNVSALQLRQSDFVESVRSIIGVGTAEAVNIELEITETVLMRDVATQIEKLRLLKRDGVPNVIDDFGTGYSSLAYLTRLPVSAVKIDRSFVEAMDRVQGESSVVATIIGLAHSLRLRVVAEGVETIEQLKMLRLLQCDELQGYLFSKPVPAADFATMLREGRRLQQ